MHLLAGDWRDGYVPYHRHPGEIEIAVRGWLRVLRIEDAFVRQPRSLRRVAGYLRAHGPGQTWRKVRSRLAEGARDRKVVAVGWGDVVATDPGSPLAGRKAVFVAPFHPACVEQVCLDARLVRVARSVLPERAGGVLHGTSEEHAERARLVAAWSPFSGRRLDEAAVEALIAAVEASGGGRDLELLPCTCCEPVPREETGGAASRPTAVLFGLGHYAKNVILPRVRPYLDVRCIHEIDPTQLGRRRWPGVERRTSAFLAPGERYDVSLIAGYHHTHAALAVETLGRGGVAVLEKPPVTDREQLEALLRAASAGRFFVAFQRRYSRFDRWLREDLGIRSGLPVHCQALVYEIPVPANHWYRWPSSGSRIVSNGCHWIDHFLHLNDYAPVRAVEASTRANGDVVVQLDLEQGAGLTLSITEHGSPRLGVRDVVRFAAGGRSATIVDQRRYRSEGPDGPLRRGRTSAREPYDRMYREIGRRIVGGHPGDSETSLRISMQAMLAAEERLGAGVRRSSR